MVFVIDYDSNDDNRSLIVLRHCCHLHFKKGNYIDITFCFLCRVYIYKISLYVYSEHIYLLNRIRSIHVMSKTDNMLNVILNNVKRECDRESKQIFIQKDFQMVY